MKKIIALTALGSFLLTIGVLAKAWAYERVAVVPAAAEINVVASTPDGEPATYFDISQMKEVTGPLSKRARILGDTEAAEQASDDLGQDVAVWQAYACTGPSDENCLENPLPLSADLEVLAISSHGSEVLPWEGAFHESGGERDDNPAKSGYVYKLPFQAEPHDYQYWNGDVNEQVLLAYDGKAEIDGLAVYKFVQDVPVTKIGTIDLPGSLVGSDQATATGDIMFATHIELSFEPETGVMITNHTFLDKYVVVDGERVLTMIKGTFDVDDETVSETVDEYRPKVLGLRLMRTWLPIVGITSGALCLVAASLLVVGRRRQDVDGSMDERTDHVPVAV